MGAINLLKRGVVEVKEFLQWLVEKVQDEEARKEILRSMGLPVENASIPPPNTDTSLHSIDLYTSRTDEEIDLEAFSSVVADIINISNALDSFVQLVSTDDPDVTAREFAEMMFQLYLMDYARLRSKKDGEHELGFNPIFLYHGLYQLWKYGDFYTELSSAHPEEFGIGSIARFIVTSFAAFGESNLNWSKRIDGRDVTDEVWEQTYNSLTTEQRVAYEEKQIRFATNLLGVTFAAVPFLKLPQFRNNVMYGFEPRISSTTPAADTISLRTVSFAATIDHIDNTAIETSTTIYLTATVRPKWHGGLGLEWLLSGDISLEKEFGEGLKLKVESKSLPTENANVEIKLEHGAGLDRWMLGEATGTRLEIGTFTVKVSGSVREQDLDFNVTAKDGAFVLHKGRSDSFIASLLPEKGITGIFDIGIGYSVKKELYLNGGAGLSVLIPCHAAASDSKKNNLILNSVFLSGKSNQDEDASFEMSVGFTASLLGISATVDRIGMLIVANKSDTFRFKPPTGIGLAFDVGSVKGGGYLYIDAEKGEYVGALELKLGARLSLKAVGVINTKLPGIDFSMLVIITTQFDPPFPLILGFTLSGVGGIVGLNRTVDLEVLKQGIKTNTIRSVLFPQDVIANIARIVSDIKQIFPPKQDRTVLGLMFELRYGKLKMLTIQLGFVVELDVGKLLILGMIALKAPQENSQVVRLQINFLGVIDFNKKLASVDASLYDSKLLAFTLTGDAAFRISWGDPCFFIFSVGGFHPAFDVPVDLGLENMKRITLSLLSGENPRLTLQTYLAITSNTFQHGAKAELYASKGSFNIYGYISYDLLFKVTDSTLTLVAHFAAGVSLRRNTSVLMGIHVTGEFSGFKPCHIHGKASVSFLFFSVSVPFSHTWGSSPSGVAEATQADILNLLREEIGDSRNWIADLPPNNNLHVSVKQISLPESESAKVVVHPFGILTFSQLVVPLNLEINKFGHQVPKDAKFFEIKTTDTTLTTETTREQFAASNFIQLTDEEKLARPSFESMISGFRIKGSAALQAPTAVNRPVEYELSYLGNRRKSFRRGNVYQFNGASFFKASKGSAASMSPISYSNNRVSLNAPEVVLVNEPQYVIANISDLKIHREELVASSYTEALQQLNKLVTQDPAMKEKVHIVSHYELNKN